MCTAWVRESGLKQIAPGIRELRDRGGKAEFLVGVDLKGTSTQGLDLAKKLGTVRVVHDPEGRTFHPKLYLARGRERGYALIGSNNLTAGGMSFNHEGALSLCFEVREKPDFLKQVDLYVRRLTEDTGICKKLTPAVENGLLAEGMLADEAKDRAHRDEDRTHRAKAGGSGSKPLFGKSKFQKRDRPPPSSGSSRAGGSNGGSKGAKRRKGSSTSRAQQAQAPDTWSKQLLAGEAQRPPDGHHTNLVRLTGVPRDVKNRAMYFRRVFFGAEQWRRQRDGNGNWLEVATISAQVRIGAKSLGTKEIEIVYGKHRDVRGRATTVLRWGDLLEEVLSQDLTDQYLLIERGRGSYTLTVTPEKPA